MEQQQHSELEQYPRYGQWVTEMERLRVAPNEPDSPRFSPACYAPRVPGQYVPHSRRHVWDDRRLLDDVAEDPAGTWVATSPRAVAVARRGSASRGRYPPYPQHRFGARRRFTPRFTGPDASPTSMEAAEVRR